MLLVGDFMLDRYVIGDAERISPEAPVPVLLAVEDEERVGGAGSVALNVVALGARVDCFGALGRDAFGDRVLKLLTDGGSDVDGLLRVDDRPTITKTRIVGLAEHRHRQQILRVDRELVRPLTPSDRERLLGAAVERMVDADVVCLEDYDKGLLEVDVCRPLIAAARRLRRPVLVDPARSNAWERYRGATLLTPNRAEFELAVGRRVSDSELDAAAAELIERYEIEAIVVTLGRDGARLVRAGGAATHFSTRPRAVYDNTGAGDAVLAMLAVAMAAGAPLEEAVPLANIAGGLEIGKFGCVPITSAEVLEELRSEHALGRGKIRTVAELLPEIERRRSRGETIVFTNGCFDLLHPGHVDLLERARQFGSVLVVGLNSDDSVRSLGKGDDRPLRRQADRARMLSALESVDYVVIFDEPDPGRLIQQVSPNVLVKGADWAGKRVVGQDHVESRGGRVELVQLVAGFSTTDELRRIREATSVER